MKLYLILFILFPSSFTSARNQLRRSNNRRSLVALNAGQEARQGEHVPSNDSKTVIGDDHVRLQEKYGPNVRILALQSLTSKSSLHHKSLSRFLKNKKDDNKKDTEQDKEAEKKAKEAKDQKYKNGGSSGGGTSNGWQFGMAKAVCKCESTRDETSGTWSTGGCTCNPNRSDSSPPASDADGASTEQPEFSCASTKFGLSLDQDGRMFYYCPGSRRS
ncbi:hypothetical protein ACA910_000445 [Epithemia clementina (nom. ined.)]